jgi:hypothetical protein
VYDVMAAARLVRKLHPDLKVTVAGSGPAAVIAAYAALLEPEIAGAVLHRPPLTHMDPEAPQFLNALRVCDIPEVLGMLAPRPVTVLAADPSAEGLKKAARIYEAAGAAAKWKVEAGK